MRKILSVVISVMLIVSSINVVYAKSSGKGNADSGNDKKYESSDINALKDQLKKFHKDKEKRKELIKKIVSLKKKDKNYTTPVFVNGEEILFDEPSVIKYNNILIPVNAVKKALGAQVAWNLKTHVVTVTKGATTITINLDSGSYAVNENGVVKSGSIAELKKKTNNRTIVLFKFLAQALKLKVDEDKDTGAVDIEDEGIISVNDNVAGTADNQFQYIGGWNYTTLAGVYMNDIHLSVADSVYTSVADSVYCQMKFDGTLIKLYGSKDPAYGIGAVSIDGGTETDMDYYAPAHADNVLLYTSPVLTGGQHVLKVRATGTKNSSSTGSSISIDRVDITTISSNPNLALKKTAISSSEYNWGKRAGKAVDGEKDTYWSSKYGNSQWIYVDLGSLQSISKVKLAWGSAYGKSYKIQVSNDAVNWTDVYSTTAGDGGTDDMTFAPVSTRYIKMLGVQSVAQSGYSLQEFEIYK